MINSDLTKSKEGDLNHGVEQKMEKMLDNIFDEMRPTMFSAEQTWKPPVDIYETTDELVVLVEIAGMKRKDINVMFENDLLKIRTSYLIPG